jgi:hypothetical protein
MGTFLEKWRNFRGVNPQNKNSERPSNAISPDITPPYAFFLVTILLCTLSMVFGIYFTANSTLFFIIAFFLSPVFLVIGIIFLISFHKSLKNKILFLKNFHYSFLVAFAVFFVTQVLFYAVGKETGFANVHHSDKYLTNFYIGKKIILNQAASALIKSDDSNYSLFGRSTDDVLFNRTISGVLIKDKVLKETVTALLSGSSILGIKKDNSGIYFQFLNLGILDNREFRGLFFGKPRILDSERYRTEYKMIGNSWFIYTIHTS